MTRSLSTVHLNTERGFGGGESQTLLLARGLHWLATEVTDRFSSPFGTPDLYAYLVPLGAGAILIALLANGRIAMIYACFAGILFGALHGGTLI